MRFLTQIFRENALNHERKRETCHQTAEEGKTIQDIAKEIHISFKDIGKIIHKVTGDESQIECETRRKKNDLYLRMLRPLKCLKIRTRLQILL